MTDIAAMHENIFVFLRETTLILTFVFEKSLCKL